MVTQQPPPKLHSLAETSNRQRFGRTYVFGLAKIIEDDFLHHGYNAQLTADPETGRLEYVLMDESALHANFVKGRQVVTVDVIVLGEPSIRDETIKVKLSIERNNLGGNSVLVHSGTYKFPSSSGGMSDISRLLMSYV